MSDNRSIFRTYISTHPWIKFRADYTELDYKTWILLGEAQSKCEHIAGTPLLPVLANDLSKLYLAKGVRATTAIEGNTLTEAEVLRRLEGNLDLPRSREYLGQEIDNILEACNTIGAAVLSGESIKLAPTSVQELNRLVLKNLPPKEGVIPGKIRDVDVGVGRYLGAPAEDCEYLLSEFCTWLNGISAPDPDNGVLFGILKAIVAHVHFAWIHPFGDGNGRTARLIEFQILLTNGVPSTTAHLLSNHYNQTRSEYYRQLDITSRSDGDLSSFIRYAVQGLVDGLREQLQYVNHQQVLVHWRDYIHSCFRGKDTKAKQRQRDLVLALTERPDLSKSVPLSEIRHVSPQVAEHYAGKTERTVRRDLEELEEMNLINSDRKGVIANIGLMLAFQPATRTNVDEVLKHAQRQSR